MIKCHLFSLYCWNELLVRWDLSLLIYFFPLRKIKNLLKSKVSMWRCAGEINVDLDLFLMSDWVRTATYNYKVLSEGSLPLVTKIRIKRFAWSCWQNTLKDHSQSIILPISTLLFPPFPLPFYFPPKMASKERTELFQLCFQVLFFC